MIPLWRRVAPALLCSLAMAHAASAAPVCPAPGSFDYMGVPVARMADGSAYTYATSAKLVDADGAPNAYHPSDAGDACADKGFGIDCLASAGYPSGSWWRNVLVADPDNTARPTIQNSGPYKGYYVSMTTLRNTEFAGPASPRSYVDAATIPYLVLPAPIYRTDGMGEMGDIGWAVNLDTGRSTPFVVADEGPVEPLGEASVAFWTALGENAPNPRTGGGLPHGRIAYVLFPGSSLTANVGWPIDMRKLADAARARLARFGGEAALRACAAAHVEQVPVETASE